MLLFLVFVPLEKVFALHPQRVFRRGYLTDLTHFLVNNVFVTVGAIALVVLAALPFFWIRGFDVAGDAPHRAAIVLAVVLVFVGQLLGPPPHAHRCRSCGGSTRCTTASSRWTGSPPAACTRSTRRSRRRSRSCPLFLLGYDGGVFAGVAVFVTLLAIFQHANVRLRFPVLRWVINTPEWHHWHHAIDAEARDKNFGLPVVDKIFGTAYLPKGSGRPASASTTRAADRLPAPPRLPVHG